MTDAKIKRFLLLDRAPAQTWELLTEPRHLEKWYCDRAEVDARPGGLFDFRGACVVGGGTRTQFSRFEKNEGLDFKWDIYGVTTSVNWTLDRQLDMTRVIVSHEADSTPEIAFTDYCGHQATATANKVCLDDVWWNNWGRLKYYVETGREPFKPDLTATPSEQVVQTMTVKVPRDQAFAALTVGQHIDGWMGQNAKPSLKVGEKFEIGWNDGPQQVTDYVPGKKISYKWTCKNEPDTHVEWSVEADGAKARITLVHSGFGKRPFIFNDYNRGWAGFMVRLALYLEKGIPAREWSGEIKS